jgi:hypothetical protein
VGVDFHKMSYETLTYRNNGDDEEVPAASIVAQGLGESSGSVGALEIQLVEKTAMNIQV